MSNEEPSKCEQCGYKPLKKEVIRFHQVERGVYRSDKVEIQTNWECPRCGWSTWKKEVET